MCTCNARDGCKEMETESDSKTGMGIVVPWFVCCVVLYGRRQEFVQAGCRPSDLLGTIVWLSARSCNLCHTWNRITVVNYKTVDGLFCCELSVRNWHDACVCGDIELRIKREAS